jgi:GT2 family glycosyltransferase
VAAEFPGVRLFEEPRAGLSFARNAGVRHATGDVVVMTNDDVIAPPEWVQRITEPFADPTVGAVTGNVLPRELDTAAQRAFEQYGGLGRGFDRRRADPEWLRRSRKHAAPTWELGATANAAFRRALFDDPAVGFLDEALGAGTPTGCSEDTDLFYRVLQAGWSMVYEPAAYVWHTHRREAAALERQLYSYSKGHVAYHLTTLLRYGDLRALYHLGVTLPKWHARNVVASLLGRRDYPLRLTALEIAGNLAGPWALLRSRRRARRLRAAGPDGS